MLETYVIGIGIVCVCVRHIWINIRKAEILTDDFKLNEYRLSWMNW